MTRVRLRWTGDRGAGTAGYTAYARDHELSAEGKASVIAGSSDPRFRGDATRWNPEELLLGAISACHQLWYLHLCADAGIVVTHYRDEADAVLTLDAEGNGRITEATLRPQVTIADGDEALATRLHDDAGRRCFIARSLAFPVRHEAVINTTGLWKR
ncbi:OsmC family protein [Sphingomonas endophytica]|uniref:Peroxiredoxin n=1 Tax=Sphingomonas endophytica TaxID=869719 RepID=A0A147I670_9SPHN|nr:OsmC family protein [Sphingomonas endophytica]KTT74281.1 peroxiredoxin [Sphingomonas endophytica]